MACKACGKAVERAKEQRVLQGKSYSALVEIVLGDDNTHRINAASLHCFLSSESYVCKPGYSILSKVGNVMDAVSEIRRFAKAKVPIEATTLSSSISYIYYTLSVYNCLIHRPQVLPQHRRGVLQENYQMLSECGYQKLGLLESFSQLCLVQSLQINNHQSYNYLPNCLFILCTLIVQVVVFNCHSPLKSWECM